MIWFLSYILHIDTFCHRIGLSGLCFDGEMCTKCPSIPCLLRPDLPILKVLVDDYRNRVHSGVTITLPRVFMHDAAMCMGFYDLVPLIDSATSTPSPIGTGLSVDWVEGAEFLASVFSGPWPGENTRWAERAEGGGWTGRTIVECGRRVRGGRGGGGRQMGMRGGWVRRVGKGGFVYGCHFIFGSLYFLQDLHGLT